MKKDCTRCGRCCTICTDIQLTREEVREGLYPRQRRNRPQDDPQNKELISLVQGWSKWIMMRGKVYESKLKREIFACVYWDPVTRDCLIYEDRPTVCRMYECVDDITGKVHGIWQGLKKGKEALCLDA